MPSCRNNNRRNQTEVRAFNQNNFITSAVQINNPSIQTVAPNEQIAFLQTNYNTGVSFSTSNDFDDIFIVASGVYKISFSGILTTAQNQTATLAISLNGTPLPASEMSQYVVTEGPSSINLSTIFKVISPSAEIGVINLGDQIDITNAKLDIVRIGNF